MNDHSNIIYSQTPEELERDLKQIKLQHWTSTYLRISKAWYNPQQSTDVDLLVVAEALTSLVPIYKQTLSPVLAERAWELSKVIIKGQMGPGTSMKPRFGRKIP